MSDLYEVKTPRKRLYAILREAREKINDNGAHWIKGALKRKLRKKEYEGEYAYCSIGALNAVEGITAQEKRDAAYILGTKGLELNPKWDWRGYGGLSKRPGERNWLPFKDHIISFNDRYSTTWKDVDKAFRKAIRSVR